MPVMFEPTFSWEETRVLRADSFSQSKLVQQFGHAMQIFSGLQTAKEINNHNDFKLAYHD